MIFMQDDLELNLLDVLYFNETDAAYLNKMRGYCALSYRYESDAEINVTSRRGDEPIRMAGGDLAFFPPDLSYFRRAAHDRMIVFHLGIPNYISYDLEVMHGVGDDIGRLFEEAFRVWNEKRPGYRYSTASILYRVFAEVRAGLDNGKPEYSRMISDAIDYISHNYADQSLSVSRLADISHVSETTFRERFRAETGTSPKRFMNDLRLEHARSLLNAACYPVTIVAEKTGFSDPKNFATAFKKAFGYPPSKQSYDSSDFDRNRTKN